MDNEILPDPAPAPAPPFTNLEDDIDMLEDFKIQECPPEYMELAPHNPTDCPYVHPGERRRRNFLDFNYIPEMCPSIPNCDEGDDCVFAHNILEYCLHPFKFCYSQCCYGLWCVSQFCLFAHHPEQLRYLIGLDDRPPVFPRPPWPPRRRKSF